MAQRTGIEAIDRLIEAFEQANPEIEDDWRGTSRPLSEMRFDPARGQDQPSRRQCGATADTFDRFLKEHGAYFRAWGATPVMPGPDGRPDPAARPLDHELPPEREGNDFVFYVAADPDTAARQGLPADVVLATTPEASGTTKPVRVVIDNMWISYHHWLRRDGENRFTVGAFTSGYPALVSDSFDGIPAEAIRDVTLHQGAPTAERLELLSETSPRHPTNLVAAQMESNPFELVYQGKLDIETGLDWSVLYGYEDGKYRRRKDKTHQASVVAVNGETMMVDWTAGQYGFSEFPMVQRFDSSAASWQREFTVRPQLSSVEAAPARRPAPAQQPVLERAI